jgi:hypothetical protein
MTPKTNNLNGRIRDIEVSKTFVGQIDKTAIQNLTVLQKIAKSDKFAVVDCLNLYGDLIWNLALQFNNLPEVTEKAVKEVFIDIWKNANRFDPLILNEKDFIMLIAHQRLKLSLSQSDGNLSLTNQV